MKTIGHEIYLILEQYLDLVNMSDKYARGENHDIGLLLCVEYTIKLLWIYKEFQYFKRDLYNGKVTFKCLGLKRSRWSSA
jgi:hypothetical protein